MQREIEIVRDPAAKKVTLVVGTTDGDTITVVRVDTDLTIRELKDAVITKAGLNVPSGRIPQLFWDKRERSREETILLQDNSTIESVGLKNGSHLALAWQAVNGCH